MVSMAALAKKPTQRRTVFPTLRTSCLVSAGMSTSPPPGKVGVPQKCDKITLSRDTAMNKKARGNRRQLFEVASRQAGYFTARQAHEAGYSRWSLYHHAKTSTFERVAHGFYRFPEFPASSFEDVNAAWLKVGSHRAVVSYETALLLHELSSVRPRKIHLTIPREARRRRTGSPLPAVQIHTTTKPLGLHEVVWAHGVKATSPARTLVDVAEGGTDPSHVIDAVTQALRRGLVAARELRRAAAGRSARVVRLIQRAIEEAGHAV